MFLGYIWVPGDRSPESMSEFTVNAGLLRFPGHVHRALKGSCYGLFKQPGQTRIDK